MESACQVTSGYTILCFYLCFILCPMPHALCPIPYALCPMALVFIKDTYCTVTPHTQSACLPLTPHQHTDENMGIEFFFSSSLTSGSVFLFVTRGE